MPAADTYAGDAATPLPPVQQATMSSFALGAPGSITRMIPDYELPAESRAGRKKVGARGASSGAVCPSELLA